MWAYENMTLSGNTRELSLADLIVVKTRDPRAHRFTLDAAHGRRETRGADVWILPEL